MPHRTLTMFTGLVLAMGTGVSTARGQCEANEFDRLVASDGEEYDMFGRSVAVFGDFAMVGAPEDDDNGEDAGSVYVYRLDGTTWIEEAKLTASDGAPEDYFGMPLAMSGNVAIVGAGGDDDNGSESGSVYVFRFNGEDWVEEAKLLPTDGPTYGPFGGPLAVAGDVALIGAYRDDDNGYYSGSAYVFRFDAGSPELWVQEAKLLASDGAPYDLFGASVAISGDTALVGAVHDNDNGLDSGSAYVFRFDPGAPGLWVEEAKLTASEGAEGDSFGSSVAVAEDTVLVGASCDSDYWFCAGSAYVFRFEGSEWVEEAKLTSSDVFPYAWFGSDVAISGDLVLIGAPGQGPLLERTGAAYVFRFDPGAPELWVKEAKLLASDGLDDRRFGGVLALSGDIALIAAVKDPYAPPEPPYVFRGVSDCNGNELLDICEITDGTAADCNTNGLPDECDIADGTSEDCNSNDIPDECDVAATDCNENGVPDDCDIAEGTSQDVNGDGVPDECGCVAYETIKLVASDGESYDHLGSSVDVSGSTAVGGAPYGDDNGDSTGSAYVFRFDPGPPGLWVEEAKLLASDGAEQDYFGRSLAVDGDAILVGAHGDDDNGDGSGAAYVFRFDGLSWVEEAKLTASDAALGDRFGFDVTISADVAAIGAYLDNGADYNTGSVYVFRFDPGAPELWVEEVKLTASDAQGDDWFGYAVAIDDSIVVVGAPKEDVNGSESGCAYVFRFNGATWIEQAKLVASDGASGDEFGSAVAISGDTVVVGSPMDNDDGSDSGSAYVFRFDGTDWIEEAKLTAPEGKQGDHFGGAVAVDGGVVLIGGDWIRPAYAFRFDGSNWIDEVKLTPCDPWADRRFGSSLAISGSVAFVGSREDDQNAYEAGAAYVFSGLAADCNNNDTWDICDMAYATSEDCNTNGIPDECDLAQGTSEDANGTGIPDECEDCNENGVLDDQDIADGTSQDCNANTIPDECDIADGTSEDCNFNDIPDECDLAQGDSNDGNGNGVPDECEFECIGHEITKLIASDGEENDGFGWSLAISGDRAVVGAWLADDSGENSGAAYVLRFDGVSWIEEAKLLASDGAPDDRVGYSVGISGEVALVGNYGDDDNGDSSGSAYVFRFDGASWIEEAKLLASEGTAYAHFGGSVAISGDIALIGAGGDDDNGDQSGSAYVFRFDGVSWIEEAKLLASDGAADDYFGQSVAVSGDIALIGAYGDDDNGEHSGSAYMFHFDGAAWVEETKLLASDGAADDRFGSSVGVFGDTVIIGANFDDDACPSDPECDSGSAYVFRFSPGAPGLWIEEAKLLASDGAAGDHFGYSVAIWGDAAAVGATGDDHDGGGSGSAYVFRFDPDAARWDQQVKLTASDGELCGGFGCSVAIAGDTGIVGLFIDVNPPGTGSAYAFRGLSDCNGNNVADICDLVEGTSEDCNTNAVPDECDIAQSTSSDLNGNGIPDECEDCNDNGIPDDLDIANGTSEDCNVNDIPDECDLADGTSQDCNTNDIPDECDIGAGTSTDLNGNGIPDECEDCNENGIPDDLDIADGTSQDCNTNDVPDECDIADGTSQDCNANGVPDECDITGGTSEDCNANDIPDECDIAEGTSEDCNTNGVPDECDIAGETSQDCNVSGIPDECEIAEGVSEDVNGNGVPDECEFECVAQETAKLLNFGVGYWRYFGRSAALFGNLPLRAVIGEPGADDAEPSNPYCSSGAAYIFGFDGTSWIAEIRILCSDLECGYSFGSSVAGHDDLALIGAPSDGGGSAYVFRFDPGPPGIWIEEAKLLPYGGGQTGDRFGRSVAVYGDAAVVGRPLADYSGSNSGLAYVFRFDPGPPGLWTQEAMLLASDAEAGDQFGDSSAMSGETAVVGAPKDDDNGEDCGSVYVFRFDGAGWIEEAKLLASDGAAGDEFGDTVAVSGDIVIVGVSDDDDACPTDPDCDSGSAYVFRFDGATWVQEAKLLASDGAAGDYFGDSVAISGDAAILGAPGDNDNGGSSGSAYVFWFYGSGWDEVAKLTASDGAASDGLGRSAAIHGGTAILGASGDDDGGDSAGSAYVFRGLVPADCNSNEMADICDTVDGTSDDCQPDGVPDECQVPPLNPDGPDCNENGVPDDCELDTDGDGDIDECDTDDDNDCVLDDDDGAPLDPTSCEDLDGDTCDDCSVGVDGFGPECDNDPSNDGTDTDGDGACNASDPDDDNDGVLDDDDADPLDPDVCEDVDEDTCDDCAIGTDDFGSLPDNDPLNDGPDDDGDGMCNAGDNCDLYNPDQTDCQPNGIGDVCDLAYCTGEAWCDDCNDNSVPDGCDIAEGTVDDLNGNGVPDECDPRRPDPWPFTEYGGTCTLDSDCWGPSETMAYCIFPPAGELGPGTCYAPSNRYVSVARDPDQHENTARRIVLQGGGAGPCWVGSPTYNAAEDMYFASVSPTSVYAGIDAGEWLDGDWPDVVHVKGCEICPGYAYDVQAIQHGSDESDEGSYSEVLALKTARVWGDIVSTCIFDHCLPPDGNPFTQPNIDDVLAVVNAFTGIRNAPLPWVDVDPVFADGEPEGMWALIGDVLAVVNAFSGQAYPGNGPLACP